MPSSQKWLSDPANQEKMRIARAKWRGAHPEYQKEYAASHKEQYNGYSKKHYEANKEYLIPYINAHRKKRIKQNTPGWADKGAIRQFYVACPQGHHVDHILPLRGKLVSGLHTLGNLQYLPAKENLKKSNKLLEVL